MLYEQTGWEAYPPGRVYLRGTLSRCSNHRNIRYMHTTLPSPPPVRIASHAAAADPVATAVLDFLGRYLEGRASGIRMLARDGNAPLVAKLITRSTGPGAETYCPGAPAP